MGFGAATDLNKRKAEPKPEPPPYPSGYEDEWNCGVNAAKAGLSETANPYINMSRRCSETWLNGYISVRMLAVQPSVGKEDYLATARAKGAEAGKHNIPWSANPYDAQGQAWLDGWAHAMRDNLKPE